MGRRGTQERRAAGLTQGWAFLEFLEHLWVVAEKEESEGPHEESLSDSGQLCLFSEAKTKAGVSFTNCPMDSSFVVERYQGRVGLAGTLGCSRVS